MLLSSISTVVADPKKHYATITKLQAHLFQTNKLLFFLTLIETVKLRFDSFGSEKVYELHIYS